MPTLRPFAYNPSQTPISGTIQIGDLAIGYPTAGFESTGLQWWNGPNEDLGYVIAKTASNQPTSLFSGDLTLSTTYKAVDISLSNSNQTATQVFSYVQSVLGDTLINNNDKVMFSVLFSMYLGMVFVLILVPSTLIYHKLGRFRKVYKKMIFIFTSCFFISCINFIL